MLLKVKCRGCQEKVFSTEKICPHCGIERPGKGKFSIFEIAIFCLMTWGAFTLNNSVGDWYESWSKERAANAAAEAAEDARLAAEKEAACKADLQCWGDKNSVASDIACARAVERLAKFSARWTADSTMRFPKFRWRDPKSLIVSYIGDSIEFQNGYGAYQAMTYVCDYDTVHNQVVDVRAKPGRL